MTQKCLRAEEQAGISDAVARWRSRGFCGHVFSKLTRFYHRKMNKMTGRLVKDRSVWGFLTGPINQPRKVETTHFPLDVAQQSTALTQLPWQRTSVR